VVDVGAADLPPPLVGLAVFGAPPAGPTPAQLSQRVGRAEDHDEVAERQDFARQRHRQHVAEHCKGVLVGLEVASAPERDRGEVLLRHHPGMHQGTRSHRHPLVDGDRQQVEPESKAHHSQAGDVTIDHRHCDEARERGGQDELIGGVAEEEGGDVQDCPHNEEREVLDVWLRRMDPQSGADQSGRKPDHGCDREQEHAVTVPSGEACDGDCGVSRRWD
jgi:hypothetical protein